MVKNTVYALAGSCMFISGMVIMSCDTWMSDQSEEMDELSSMEMKALAKSKPKIEFEKPFTFLRTASSLEED
jgi:hypothetical protein